GALDVHHGTLPLAVAKEGGDLERGLVGAGANGIADRSLLLRSPVLAAADREAPLSHTRSLGCGEEVLAVGDVGEDERDSHLGLFFGAAKDASRQEALLAALRIPLVDCAVDEVLRAQHLACGHD